MNADPVDDDEECYECGGEGFILNECFEDTCCCLDPEMSHGYRPCPNCMRIVNAEILKGKEKGR